MNNFMLKTDSYKASHWMFLDPAVQYAYSYFESRGGIFSGTVFFGAQAQLMKHFTGVQITHEKIAQAEAFLRQHFGKDLMNKAGWEYIADKHNGMLPLRICAVPEGTYVPAHNVLMTVENTDANVPWLTNYAETLLVQIWYPTTVATNSNSCRNTLKQFLERTGDPAGLPFKLHDFGYRGVTCEEQAGIGGAAHLVMFNGTDTLAGIRHAMEYYDADMCGFSIPATEHFIMTMRGREREAEVVADVLNACPDGLVACVGDQYDIFNFAGNVVGTQLRDKVLSRNGTLVVRPDSGDPPMIVCKVLEILWDKFGGEYNQHHMKVLDPHVRVIQGDGIDRLMLHDVLAAMEAHGFSADNIAFGSGGGLLQKLDRDTNRFAFKCSSVRGDGFERDVYKSPITDVVKQSKRGRLALVRNAQDNLETIPEDAGKTRNLLQPIFVNGNLVNKQKFSDIVARARW